MKYKTKDFIRINPNTINEIERKYIRDISDILLNTFSINILDNEVPVENIFQSSKVFINGGPYI